MTFLMPVRGVGGVPYDVKQLDVLVWNLAAFANVQRLIVDVGLLVQAGEAPVSSVALVLPFAADPRDWEDVLPRLGGLSDIVLPSPAALSAEDGEIRAKFDGLLSPVPVRGHDFHDKPVVHLSLGPRRRRATWSVVELTLNRPLEPLSTAYVRARFHVYGPSALVSWKRSGLAINGGIFDIRTYQVPVAGDERLATVARERGIRPDKTNITLVLRTTFGIRFQTPRLSPALLEHGIWSGYLNRVTDLREEGALVAYSCNSSTPNQHVPLGTAALFVDASREFGLWSVWNFVRVGVAVAIIVIVANAAGVLARGSTNIALGTTLGKWIAGVSVSSIGVGYALLKGIPKVRDRVHRARNWLRRTERWVLRKLYALYGK